MKNRKIDFLYKTCILVYLLSLGYAFYLNWGGKYFSMTIVACLTPFIMPIIMKLLKIKVPQEFHIINIIFVYIASLWGSCLGGYNNIQLFDKFTHFFSGIIFLEVAYIFYKHYLRNDNRKVLMFVVINAINAMVAVLWEIYEYILLILFNYDAIRHFKTGVHDSITDMIVAIIGGLLLSIYLIHYDNSDKEHFFIQLERKIHNLNSKK